MCHELCWQHVTSIAAVVLQDARLPLAKRAGLALGSAGPSITLAAACEVLAFGLGSLTPMPAVRNFSICAAVAVALDFVLQVRLTDGLLNPQWTQKCNSLRN